MHAHGLHELPLEPHATTADVSALLSDDMHFELGGLTVDVGAAAAVAPPPSHDGGLAARRGRRASIASAASPPSEAEPLPLPLPPPALAPVDQMLCGIEDLTEAELESLPTDASRRKVRHNLTERRRVDRMNQLFHRLAMAICDEAAAPAITMSGMDDAERMLTAEGKELAKPKWSKADVLEGALNVVNDLRRQLAEERLARSLGVPAGVGLETADFPEPDADVSEQAMADACCPLSAVPGLAAAMIA